MKDYVIIPTYNEKENIAPLVGEIFKILPEINILIVDDNSPDKTADVVKKEMMRYSNLHLMERPQKDGLGGAYIAAFRKLLADNDLGRIITMDGDFSHNPKYIPKLLQICETKDLAIGSRYVRGGGIAKWEFWRRFLSFGANMYVRAVLQKPIHDWTAGFQCIRASALKKIDFDSIDLSGYAFLQELKYMLLVSGASFQEIPIVFEARRGGESKISGFIIREGILGPWKIKKHSN